jgi:GntR family transcriptional regulator/MocR family aminotransferase
VQNPPFNQAALSEFLTHPKFDAHIRKCAAPTGSGAPFLLDALGESFGGGCSAYGDSAGLHVAIDFPGRRFDAAFKQKCLRRGVLRHAA